MFHSAFVLFLLSHGIQATVGNKSLATNSSTPRLTTGSPTSGGCLFSYSGSSPLYTSGTTVLPPLTSGGESRTLPCDWFLQFAYSYERAQNLSITSSTNASASTLQSPTPTAPATLKYKDPNLTGCYAGTGGSTILTLTSGDAVLNSPEIIVGAEPRTLTYSCSDFFALDLEAWHIMTSFAESPSCASYARDFEEWLSLPHNSQVPDPIEYVPGVQNGGAHIPFMCCGGCKFAMPEVEVLYWSTTTSAECFPNNATVTSHAKFVPRSSKIPAPTDASESQAATFAVVDGSTLDFPSLYLAIHGAVSVYDYCGVRGNTYYNPTIAIPPGSLSTLSWTSNLIQLAGYPPQTGAYDPAACRTYGVNNGSTMSWLNGLSSWTTSVSYSMGPPYNPILLPPAQLTALDPEWEACTAWDNYGDNAYDVFYGLYDPPRVLNAAPALVEPSTTSPGPASQQTPPAPQPAGSILSADPKITARPQMAPDPSPAQAGSPDQETSDAGLASFILQPFQRGPTRGVDDPANPTRSIASPNHDPLESPGQDSENNRPDVPLILPNQDPGSSPPDSDLPLLIPGESPGNNSPGSNPAFITISNTPYYLAPQSTITSSNIKLISPNPLGTSQPILTIDGKAYTANRDSQYVISSQTLSPGGSTVNVNGLPYSLALSTTPPPSIASILSAISLISGPILTINGKTYTADSASQYIVGSQTLTPGGSPITVNNVPFSLPSSANAIISGSSTIPLDPQNTLDPTILSMLSAAGIVGNDPPQTYTVDDIPITGNPNTLTVGGATLTPGSPPLTVSGHTFSLASAGLLVVDGHTSELAAHISSILPENGQAYDVDGIALIGNPNALRVGSTTLTPDSPQLTLSGHTLSLASGGALIVDGHTSRLASELPTNLPTDPQTYTIDGIVLTKTANILVVGSITLTPGSPPLTISGHTLSLAPGGAVIVDGHTSTLAPAILSTSSRVVSPTVGPPSGGSEDNTDVFAGSANRGKYANSMLQVFVLVTFVSCLVF